MLLISTNRRLGVLRPFAFAASVAVVLGACQSEALHEGLDPPSQLGLTDSSSWVDSALVTASAVVIQGLTLSPTSANLTPGQTITFTPLGWLASGPPPIIASVTWTATGGTITSGGVYTAGSVAGTYRVLARSTTSWNEEAATITISGSPTTSVTGITLLPATVTLGYGAKQQFTATAQLSNGTTQSNPIVTWTATGGSVSSTGLYTAGSTAGSYRVIAASTNGKRDTSVVTLASVTPTITSISLTPATASVAAGATKQFSVSATLSNGTTQANPAVTWTATGGSISGTGLYTAGSTAGSYRVIAASANGKRDTSVVTLTVPAPTITAINLTPSTASVVAGATLQFSVSATLSNGTTQANPAVTWSATGGTVANGLYTAGSTTGSYRLIAVQQGGTRADTSAITVTGATTPPPSPGGMYFNSSESGCGTDSNALFCDDFEDGDWYSKDCDQANSSGGLLQTDGWCGNIYANPITPAKAAVCGGKGFRSNCAASSGNLSGQQGRNMAEHGYNGNVKVTEASFRLYFQPQSDYDGGHEKMFDFTRGVGTGQMVALCYNYFGNETIKCIPYLHQDGGLGGTAPDYPAWMGANVGSDLTLQRGHWYFFEMHVRLNNPGSYDGVFEWWLNDCGTDGSACGGSPTLRSRYTNVMFRNSSESNVTLGGNWIENWANPGSSGTLLYDNVRATRGGPVGFAR